MCYGHNENKRAVVLGREGSRASGVVLFCGSAGLFSSVDIFFLLNAWVLCHSLPGKMNGWGCLMIKMHTKLRKWARTTSNVSVNVAVLISVGTFAVSCFHLEHCGNIKKSILWWNKLPIRWQLRSKPMTGKSRQMWVLYTTYSLEWWTGPDRLDSGGPWLSCHYTCQKGRGYW